MGDFLYMLFNLVRNVGNHLNSCAQILPPTLFLNHVIVNPPGGNVVVPPHLGMGEPLVVTEIQIRFRAIIGDIDLTVLKRIHGPWIDIDIRIKFQNRNF